MKFGHKAATLTAALFIASTTLAAAQGGSTDSKGNANGSQGVSSTGGMEKGGMSKEGMSKEGTMSKEGGMAKEGSMSKDNMKKEK